MRIGFRRPRTLRMGSLKLKVKWGRFRRLWRRAVFSQAYCVLLRALPFENKTVFFRISPLPPLAGLMFTSSFDLRIRVGIDDHVVFALGLLEFIYCPIALRRPRGLMPTSSCECWAGIGDYAVLSALLVWGGLMRTSSWFDGL